MIGPAEEGRSRSEIAWAGCNNELTVVFKRRFLEHVGSSSWQEVEAVELRGRGGMRARGCYGRKKRGEREGVFVILLVTEDAED